MSTFESSWEEALQELKETDGISAMLAATVEQEREIDAFLDPLVDKDSLENIETTVKRLQEHLSANLSSVLSGMNEVATNVVRTSELAENVSGKVKELDVAKTRVTDSIEYLTDILDLKNCADGVRKARLNRDYDAATEYISRYRKFEAAMPASDPSMNILREETNLVRDQVRDQLKGHVDAGDTDGVCKTVKYFSVLGLEKEGLDELSFYLKKVIATNADDDYKKMKEQLSLDEIDEASFFTELIVILFEDIAGTLEDVQPIFDKFGPGALLRVIQELQGQCDIQAKKLMDQFTKERDIKDKVERILKNQRTQAGQKSSKPDARELDELLEEIAVITQRCAQYYQFVRQKAKDCVEAIVKEGIDATSAYGTMPGTTNPGNAGLPKGRELNECTSKLHEQFLVLEKHVVLENVKKAIEIDETEEDQQTSSVVDDSFYVIQKSIARAISTHSLAVATKIIAFSKTVLCNEYTEFLGSVLREDSGFGSKLLGLESSSSKKISQTTAMNNIQMSVEYIGKLKSEMTAVFEDVFTKPKNKEDGQKAFNQLDTAMDKLTGELDNALSRVCSNVYPRLRSFVEGFKDVNYVLSESDYNDNEVNDPFMQKLVTGLGNILKPYEENLSPGNFDRFVQKLLHELVTQLEQVILKKKFNQLGALQLDKDLRALVNFFTNLIESTVRDKFSRLSQIALVVNVERVAEIYDYWNDASMSWQVEKREVKLILALREDFSQSEISKLKL